MSTKDLIEASISQKKSSFLMYGNEEEEDEDDDDEGLLVTAEILAATTTRDVSIHEIRRVDEYFAAMRVATAGMNNGSPKIRSGPFGAIGKLEEPPPDIAQAIASGIRYQPTPSSSSEAVEKCVSFAVNESSNRSVEAQVPLSQEIIDTKLASGVTVDPTTASASLKTLQEASKILKTGIPANAGADEVIDAVVKVFSVLKRNWPPTEASSEVVGGTLHTPPLQVSRSVISQIGNIIGEWKYFFNVGLSRRQLAHERLRSKFETGDFSPTSKDDIAIFIRYKPMELIGDMITYVILELIGGDFLEAREMTIRLKQVLESPFIYKKVANERIHKYLEHSFQLLIKTLHSVEGDLLKNDVIPNDDEWTDEMLQNRFLIWFVVERHLLNINESPSDLLATNIHDVEWLITEANSRREKRLKSPFPKKIDPAEKAMVKLAYSLEPENPFVILAMLDILSDRKNVSQDFEMTCRNLLHKCGRSVVVMLRVTKYFLKRGRNRNLAYECLKRAIAANPRHGEANYLCGKYLCKANSKIDIGTGVKDSFFRMSIISDLSDYNNVFEYFKTALGKTLSSGPSLFGPSDDGTSTSGFFQCSGAMAASRAGLGDTSRYTETMDSILKAPYSKAWTVVQRAQLEFLSALSHYLRTDVDVAMDILLTIYQNNQIISIIRSMDQLCETYNWDKSRLSFDKFRQWLRIEYDDLVEAMAVERLQHAEENSYEDVDDYEDDEENEDYPSVDPDDDDPTKEMLSYLLRLL